MELNIIISDDISKIDLHLENKIFFHEEDISEIEILPSDTNILDILVKANVFKSKSQARKNWKKETEIPYGFSDLLLGKKKNRVCILKIG